MLDSVSTEPGLVIGLGVKENKPIINTINNRITGIFMPIYELLYFTINTVLRNTSNLSALTNLSIFAPERTTYGVG